MFFPRRNVFKLYAWTCQCLSTCTVQGTEVQGSEDTQYVEWHALHGYTINTKGFTLIFFITTNIKGVIRLGRWINSHFSADKDN